MTITVYRLQCDPRKVDKSGTGDLYSPTLTSWSGNAVTGTLRDRCSITDPVFMLELDDSEVGTFNYIFVNEFGRYYFVKETIVERSGLVSIYCHVDVLYSFKSGITALSAFVERTQSNLKPFIVDSKRPMSSKITNAVIANANDPTTLNPTVNVDTDPTMVVTLATPPGASGASPATSDTWDVRPAGSRTGNDIGQLSWAVTKSQLITLFTDFYSTSFSEITNKWIFGTSAEGIVNIIAFPFKIDQATVVQPTTSGLKMFGHDFAITAHRILDTAILPINFGPYTYKLTPSNYLDFEPYTKATLYLPYAGMVDVPMCVMNDGGIDVTYRVNMVTGETVINVMPASSYTGDQPYIRTLHANLGEVVPITRTNCVEVARNYVNGTVNALTGFVGSLSGNLSGMASVGKNMLSMAGNPTTMSGANYNPNLARLNRYTPYVLITKQVDETPTDYGKFVGYPYEQIATLSTLSGFTVVGEVFGHMSFAQEDEQDEIFRLLKTGVIL